MVGSDARKYSEDEHDDGAGDAGGDRGADGEAPPPIVARVAEVGQERLHEVLELIAELRFQGSVDVAG